MFENQKSFLLSTETNLASLDSSYCFLIMFGV